MWGPSIIGFGSQPLRYASGRELVWPVIAFAPRKRELTLYLTAGLAEGALFKKLGKFKTSKACLYIRRLSDVDLPTLEKLIAASVKAPSS